jgi:tetratricopeptide (TPR) repeat protein
VLPQWAESNPLYGYVLGMYAFGLEEAGNMAEAETAARKALALNPEDCWAAHALAHILETESRQDEGVAFLKSTRADWSKGTALSVHNGFHLGLYYLEAGNIAGLLAEYDRYIEPRLGEDAILDLVDAAALLWRVELAGGDVGERWGPITAAWFRHVDDHILAFNDMHIAFCAARSGNQHRLQVLGSLDDYQATGSGDNHAVTVSVGRQVVEAVLAFGAEDYAKTVDLLLPIRYETVKIGGSNAQRDILAQTLIAAAERLGDYRLARALLNERVALRPTDFTKRHLARVEEKLAA